MSSLDLFSTSQTKLSNLRTRTGRVNRKVFDECLNNAPYFAYQVEGKKWGVVQGCCNDWNCPRCGQQRAREEYGRIVAGAREVGKNNQLYMMTITCQGEGEDHETAERNYLERTNRLLTRIRAAHKRAGGEWYYSSVTERQMRKHPHSHYLTTYCPPDAVLVKKGQGKYYATVSTWFQAKHETLQSEILEYATAECGLGYIYDISRLQSVEGASRYIAKYLFKETIFTTVWPKGWRRVRYSQSWPKLPQIKTNSIVLLSDEDWLNLAHKALIVTVKDDNLRDIVKRKLFHADVIVK